MESRLQELEKKAPSTENAEPAPPAPPDTSQANATRAKELEQQYLDDLENQARKQGDTIES